MSGVYIEDKVPHYQDLFNRHPKNFCRIHYSIGFWFGGHRGVPGNDDVEIFNPGSFKICQRTFDRPAAVPADSAHLEPIIFQVGDDPLSLRVGYRLGGGFYFAPVKRGSGFLALGRCPLTGRRPQRLAMRRNLS